eukprot:979585-Prymnesium_polylepis.1
MCGARSAKNAIRGRVAHGLGGWWRVILHIKWASSGSTKPQHFLKARYARRYALHLSCAIAEASSTSAGRASQGARSVSYRLQAHHRPYCNTV